MELGFVSAILPEYSFEELLDLAQSIGYDCIEIMCWPPGKAERRYAGVTHLDVDQLDVDRVRALMIEKSVKISALGYYPNPLSPNEQESRIAQNHITKCIRASAQIGVGFNTFVGRDWNKSVEDNWEGFLKIWPPIIKYAEELGVSVGIENCPMLFTKDEWPGGKNLASTPQIWSQMFAQIPGSNFGLNFDPSHLLLQDINYTHAIRNFHDKLFHVHAKDLRIDQENLDKYGRFAYPNQYHTPKIPGLGQIDWDSFFTALTEVGYDGPVCIEVEDRAFENSLEARISALTQSYDFLRPYIPKNQQL